MPLYHLDQRKVLAILERSGAIVRNDHFVYSSGLHGSVYVDKRRACEDPRDTYEFARQIALFLRASDVETIVAPAYGAISLGDFVALELSHMGSRAVPCVIAEKDDKGWLDIPEHSRHRVAGKRVAIVEDVLTTGESAREVVSEVRTNGGQIVCCAAIVNRGRVKADDVGLAEGQLHSLLELDLEAHKRADCPMCAQAVPVNQVLGHGKQFMESFLCLRFLDKPQTARV